MSDSGKAVFLSYASQDAEAAKRICEALRASGVEVWFDQSELRGGDTWDAMIRKRIKDCALFVPLITPTTNARAEGYFRLEWKLAVDRSHLMADDQPFLFPVVIGDINDATARVPDKFRDVQWTRLRLDETPAELAGRVARLLSGGKPEDIRLRQGYDGQGGQRTEVRTTNPIPARKPKRPLWLIPVILAAVFAGLWQQQRNRLSAPAVEPKAAAVPAATATAPITEARQLIARARAMSLGKYDSSAEDFAAAENLVKKALELDPNDAEIWAFSSLLNFSFGSRGFDHAPARVAAARSHAERALSLDPDSPEAQFALARWQRDNEEPAVAEASFKKILAREPNHIGALSGLAWIYDLTDRVDESAALSERIVTLPGSNPALSRYTEFLLFFHRARFEEADRCIRQSIATQPSANSLAGLANLLLTWKGDTDGAARVLAAMPTAARSLPRTIWMTAQVQLCQRAPAETLQTLDRFSGDYIQDNFFAGPKTFWVGRAHALAGRKEAARLAWEAGLDVVNARLKTEAQNRELHLMRGELLALLGSTDEALREARVVEELARGRDRWWFGSPVLIYAALGRADDALPLLEKLRATGPVEHNVGWPLTPALLRLDPRWDKLRGDPRFQKLCADPAVPSSSSLSLSPSTPPDSKSVAVLAFANLSDDKANEYFSDGISEELLNVLAKVPGLKVSARTSAFYFKGKEVPITEIAKQLGVAYVVEGSVRKHGDKVRITVKLIKAADGFHVWGETFTRDLKDIFAVQDEIAGLVSRNLELKLGTTVAATVNPQAFELYLQGRHAWRQRNEAGYVRAEELFERALALDPNFARAHAALADVWMIRAQAGNEIGRYDQRGAPILRKMSAKIQRALEIDPGSADAHATLGAVRWTEWKFEEGIRELRFALSLNPNNASAHQWLGRALMSNGQLEEALSELRQAHELDPFFARVADNYGFALINARRPGDALDVLERALAVQPDSRQALRFKTVALAELGRNEEAIAAAKHYVLEEVDSGPHFVSYALACAGAQREAEVLLALADQKMDASKAATLLALGRREESLVMMQAGQMKVQTVELLYYWPIFDQIRHEPRFVQLLDTLAVTEAHARAQAWRAAHPPEKTK